ncbi:MAG: ABC transporter substrate-binding protein [Devosia sp. 67-54]|uniref:ABC transporter substrate-binding protein n=1 Tax=unclassified Devosia TaxID=196773 RepID=UPI00086EA4D6|nr:MULTISPECIES: ABC transporter substrate-binding protein [unclassified Devosia]MBN9306578.1 ABC transporter substrate-binding protein [Devosia sp.]ODU62606.1 MAG: ABC transporter substrate-binding protein [Acetobacteraceae bacterium SCN 69-10]OJX15862.1 MAG: ABC transporter substrate-binding protein [Devosia sp. 67-54]
MTEHRTGLTRRGFLASSAAAAGAVALGAGTNSAQAADTLKVGFISPRTGPLGGFGEGDGYVLDMARKALANGFKVGDKTYAVTIIDQDTQSDPARAGQLAKDLINNQGIDMMLTTSTPEVVNPVADACEAAGVPCLGTIVPWEAFYFGRGAKPGAPSPFKWTYLFSFGTEVFAETYLSMWKGIETNKKIGVMYPNDADGNAIRAALAPLLEKGGYTIIDPGPYEDGTTDYSSQIQKFKDEGVEMFNTFPIPPDFAAFWRQAAQQGLTKQIKIAQIAKTGLFPSDIEAVGDLGDKLATAAYWHWTFPYKSSLTGMSGEDLASGYEATAGKQRQQQLGASMALLDGGFAALAAAGTPNDKAALAKALSTLNTTTMVGKVDFNTGPVPNVSEAPIIGAQWVKSKPGSKYPFDLVIVDNAPDPNVPVAAKLLPYNS